MNGFKRRNLLMAMLAAPLATVSGFFARLAHAQVRSTSGADYGLQGKVNGLNIPNAMTVIGCGGFGSWPALFSAMCGVKEMLLIDASDTDAMDLARTPLRPRDVGRPKATALAELIKEYRPEIKVRSEKRFVEPADNDIYFGELLFDGTNYEPLSRALPSQAQKRGLRFVHGFYNGSIVGVTDFYPEKMRYKPGNELPVWIGNAALSGVLAIHSAFSTPIQYVGDISDISMDRKSVETFFQAPTAVDMDK